METSRIGFGIVGTGMIAGVIADAIAESANSRLAAVSSRRIENARSFAEKRTGAEAVQGIDALLARPDVRAVYVATPTVAKEEIALAAIGAGKHVLVDKPFLNEASLVRMTTAAKDKNVLFMDATHFVHHPRTAAIRAASAEKIGSPRTLHSAFYFPFADRANNIRFDMKLEPTGAIGDMAWYCMRAVVEYLRPKGRIVKVMATTERDPGSLAVVRVTGLIVFESGEASTFDAGYTADTLAMDLELVGTTGIISLDDFVLDWTSSFAFKNPDIKNGYFHRAGMATRKETTFISTPASTPQEVAMIETFVELTGTRNASWAEYAEASRKTQEYLDAIWESVRV
jgi:predicted dehydrogenase